MLILMQLFLQFAYVCHVILLCVSIVGLVGNLMSLNILVRKLKPKVRYKEYNFTLLN